MTTPRDHRTMTGTSRPDALRPQDQDKGIYDHALGADVLWAPFCENNKDNALMPLVCGETVGSPNARLTTPKSCS